MVIKIKALGFAESGSTYTIKVTRKKLNGIYGICSGKEEETFFPYDIIQIIQVDDDEKKMSVEF